MKIIPQHNILYKLSVFQDLQEYRTPKHPDSIFYHKNGIIYFELDLKNNILWCDYERVWSVFSEQNRLKYSETQRVIKNVVEQHTNWGLVTPTGYFKTNSDWVEQHTNWGLVTPHHYW